MELRIFVDSLGILEVPNIQQEVVLGQYMQGTDSVVGERRLSLIVHYRQEELTLQGALIVLIKGCTAQEEEVRKKLTNIPSQWAKHLTVKEIFCDISPNLNLRDPFK